MGSPIATNASDMNKHGTVNPRLNDTHRDSVSPIRRSTRPRTPRYPAMKPLQHPSQGGFHRRRLQKRAEKAKQHAVKSEQPKSIDISELLNNSEEISGNTHMQMPPTEIMSSTSKTQGLTRTRQISPKRIHNRLIPIEDMLEGHTGPFPSCAFGDVEKVGLSKIGHAEKEVHMWESILQTHKDGTPHLFPVCEARLKQAKEARAVLADTGDNHRVGVKQAYKDELEIKERLETLEWALETSKYEPERENIRGAIASYKNCEIGYSEKYTLIYAGRIVDRAETYGDFIRDRNSRLDRYANAFGSHWLWYESPLNILPEERFKMMPSVALRRGIHRSGLGQYRINQGYWKRSALVTRLSERTNPHVDWAHHEYGKVDFQEPGPKLSFNYLMDSGATFPSLHREDIVKLGIDNDSYAAQTVYALSTAAATIRTRAYEMFVCVLDDQGKHLVDAKNATDPDSAKYLGGLCPVVECVNPIEYDPQGFEVNHRLSGMLPFLTCDVSSASTQNTLYLGGDRNDSWESTVCLARKNGTSACQVRSQTSRKSARLKASRRFCLSHQDTNIDDKDNLEKKFVRRITINTATAM